MVKLRKSKNVSQPSSTLGLMRFSDSDASGPKITPEFVIALSLVIIIVILVLQAIS